jgi:hypothetical protein
MKNLLKLSALAAVLVAPTTFTFASAVSLNSGAGETVYQGYVAPTTSGNASGAAVGESFCAWAENSNGGAYCSNASSWITPSPAAPSGSAAAVNITPPAGTWNAAIGSSSWVSFEAGTQPNGSVASACTGYTATCGDPNGLYYFSDSFTTSGGVYNGSLMVQADDTVAVYLNGTEIVTPTAIGTDTFCSNGSPTCSTSDMISFGSSTSGFNSDGSNTLEFVVDQSGFNAMGLDYAVSSSVTPEPSTLLMFGTGLLGSAGALFRRKRA